MNLYVSCDFVCDSRNATAMRFSKKKFTSGKHAQQAYSGFMDFYVAVLLRWLGCKVSNSSKRNSKSGNRLHIDRCLKPILNCKASDLKLNCLINDVCRSTGV